MNTTHTTLTRRELYDLVWQTPMVKLAAKYGLSGRGLAKLCERHAIPVPGRGHWVATHAGYVMERDPLPGKPPPEMQVEITGNPDRDREEDPTVGAQIAYETDHPIVVPDKLNRPHPLVAKAREEGGVRLPINVSAKQVPRALRFFDALFKACEARGFSVKHVREDYKSRTTLEVHGEEMAIGLDEPNRRSDHVLTAEEEARKKRNGYLYSPRYDFTPTGRFVFTIDEWADGMRHRWTDRDRRPIEACLNEIMVAFVRISVTVLRPRRIEAVRRHQLEVERERLWQIERAKLDAVNKAVPDWRRAQDLREFIAAVERAAGASGESVEDGRLAEWLVWARDLAERSDPVKKFVRDLSKPTSSDDH